MRLFIQNAINDDVLGIAVGEGAFRDLGIGEVVALEVKFFGYDLGEPVVVEREGTYNAFGFD